MAELTPRMKELVQPYLAGIEPYDPNFTPTRINLSANENTYPVPAGVREAVDAALAATPLNRYPDPMSNDLRDELAAWHGVARENVCVGNGGDELLYNYLLAFKSSFLNQVSLIRNYCLVCVVFVLYRFQGSYQSRMRLFSGSRNQLCQYTTFSPARQGVS